jgi:hypothetical protein
VQSPLRMGNENVEGVWEVAIIATAEGKRKLRRGREKTLERPQTQTFNWFVIIILYELDSDSFHWLKLFIFKTKKNLSKQRGKKRWERWTRQKRKNGGGDSAATVG